jgi:hypothetical protein
MIFLRPAPFRPRSPQPSALRLAAFQGPSANRLRPMSQPSVVKMRLARGSFLQASLPCLPGILFRERPLTRCNQFISQPITVSKEHAQQLLELAEDCLCLRSVETSSLQ